MLFMFPLMLGGDSPVGPGCQILKFRVRGRNTGRSSVSHYQPDSKSLRSDFQCCRPNLCSSNKSTGELWIIRRFSTILATVWYYGENWWPPLFLPQFPVKACFTMRNAKCGAPELSGASPHEHYVLIMRITLLPAWLWVISFQHPLRGLCVLLPA